MPTTSLPSSHYSTESSTGYHTIGEAADILGVSVPTIRMYEREGLIIPYRKDSGHRRFSGSDIERIRCLREMINEKKVSLAGIRHVLSLIPCWKIKNCPPDQRDACPAFTSTDKPCWMLSGKSWECRSADCRLCPVYTDIANCATLKQTIASHTVSAETFPTAPPSVPIQNLKSV
ncbi:MAG TPA: MerR family transcriptional regulator [Bacteroidetes bacterium]|nr:MerR family transcriptional regulator [Bacteroidota bacterium]